MGTFSAVDADAWTCPFLSSKLLCNLDISSSMFLALASASCQEKKNPNNN